MDVERAKGNISDMALDLLRCGMICGAKLLLS